MIKLRNFLLSTAIAVVWIVFAPVIVKADVPVDAEHFPDENFREYISEKCDNDNDDTLSTAEIDGVTSIDLSFWGISDLKGIDYFTALESLECSFGMLKSLDVSNNTKLTYLDCSCNWELASLNVSNNTKLTYLDCSYNELTNLDVISNTSLKELYCAGNKLTSLDVSKNPALEYLGCEFNELTVLDVSKNLSLKGLLCDDNQLTSLYVGKNMALETLSCSDNELKLVDVSKNSSLKILGCGSTKLTSLDISNNPKLEGLNCSSNQLTNLDISKNPLLEWLWCDGNQLSTLDISNNPNITELFAWGNEFNTIDVSAIKALENLKYSDEYGGNDGYIITLDPEKRLLIYEKSNPEPELKPNKTIKVGKKAVLKAKKKIASVETTDDTIVSARVKGKKVKIKGLNTGTVTVTALDKNGEEIRSWIVQVK